MQTKMARISTPAYRLLHAEARKESKTKGSKVTLREVLDAKLGLKK